MAKKTTPKETGAKKTAAKKTTKKTVAKKTRAAKTKKTAAKAKGNGGELVVMTQQDTASSPPPQNGGMGLFDPSTEKLQKVRAALSGALKTSDWEIALDPSAATTRRPHVPTGSVILDFLIGGWPDHTGFSVCPGFPRGAITHIGGDEGTGKTTLATVAAAAVCGRGGSAVFIDWEHAFDARYAISLGVPCKSDLFMWSQPNTLEDGFRLARRAARERVDLIVFDSVGAAIPEKMVGLSDEKLGDLGEVGLLQRKWSRFLPELQIEARKGQSAIVAISQKRAKVGSSGFGDSKSWQGGFAWKFFASVRMDLRRVGGLKRKEFDQVLRAEKEVEYASIIRARIEKSKVSSTMKKEQDFVLRHGEGIDSVLSAIEIGERYGLVQKKGNWYEWQTSSEETVRGQGKEKFREAIKAAGAWHELYRSIRPALYSSIEEETAADEAEG